MDWKFRIGHKRSRKQWHASVRRVYIALHYIAIHTARRAYNWVVTVELLKSIVTQRCRKCWLACHSRLIDSVALCCCMVITFWTGKFHVRWTFTIYSRLGLLSPTKEEVNIFARVCLSVCMYMYVCLLAILLKNACVDFIHPSFI